MNGWTAICIDSRNKNPKKREKRELEVGMAKLTTAQRKRIPKSKFGIKSRKKKGGAGRGGYPMPDRAHAANAKARAKQMLMAGKLSRSEYEHIVAMANKMPGNVKISYKKRSK